MSESQLGQSVRRPLVFLSIFDWWYHAHGHIDIRLAHHLARQTKVLFVNSIGMRVPLPFEQHDVHNLRRHVYLRQSGCDAARVRYLLA